MAATAAGFDVILMDIRMPGLDGLEVCRRIRVAETATQSKRTRIIALTANAFEEDRHACAAAGIDAFLTKPVDLARLAQALAPATLTAA
jgi:CheY-like chemotaxis protein